MQAIKFPHKSISKIREVNFGISLWLIQWFTLNINFTCSQVCQDTKKAQMEDPLYFFPQSSNSTIISYTYIYFSQYILNLVLQDPIYKVIVICTYILHSFIDNQWCVSFSKPKMITLLLMNIGNHTWTHWAILVLFVVVSCDSIGNYGPPQIKCWLLISSFF